MVPAELKIWNPKVLVSSGTDTKPKPISQFWHKFTYADLFYRPGCAII